jgi:hypothetical protein
MPFMLGNNLHDYVVFYFHPRPTVTALGTTFSFGNIYVSPIGTSFKENKIDGSNVPMNMLENKVLGVYI